MKTSPLLRQTLAALVLGTTVTATHAAAQWKYFGSFDANGVPRNMIDFTGQLPATLYNEIFARLPERTDVRKTDPALITDDLGANLQLLEDAEITVVFIHEGAGYRNSVGFFTFDPANKPTATRQVTTNVMFPNFSDPYMKIGNAVKLGSFKAGSGVGFTILADAWNGTGVKQNQPDSKTFYSMKGLNPEAASTNLNAHTVLLSKPDDELLILGFEDMNRTQLGTDHDFNDAIIALKVTPFSAVDRSRVQSLVKTVKDTDGDTIPDDLDAFPKDPERASRKFYPSAIGQGSFAFEDNWPKTGDFDMNDLVVGYRTVEVLNARNEVVDLQLNYQITARGAQDDNAFAVHLPGVPRSSIDSTRSTLKIGDTEAVSVVPEAKQREAVVILAPSVNSITKTISEPGCYGFFNTIDKCKRYAPVPVVANLHFDPPLAPSQLGAAPYNPFIYKNRYAGRGREVHLVDHPPTDLVDPKLFGTDADASRPAEGLYYRTTAGMPFALDIPETWRYPTEWSPLHKVYLNFSSWAAGTDSIAADRWYVTNFVEGLLFKP